MIFNIKIDFNHLHMINNSKINNKMKNNKNKMTIKYKINERSSSFKDRLNKSLKYQLPIKSTLFQDLK